MGDSSRATFNFAPLQPTPMDKRTYKISPGSESISMTFFNLVIALDVACNTTHTSPTYYIIAQQQQKNLKPASKSQHYITIF